jgi:hypothetical protein
MALEDPLHSGYHRIKNWNDSVFAKAKEKAMEDFEKRLPKQKKKETKWTSLDI